MKEPWSDYPHVWKNSTAFFNYLRGCLRKAWSTNPIKLEVIREKRKQIKNPNPRGNKPTVWGFDCEMCKKTFTLSEGQVDHKTPAGKLSKVDDIQRFVERLLFVSKDDLRLVCKGCNSALALADKRGISYEASVIEKKTIEIIKQKKEIIFLESKGVTPAKNAKLRRQQITEILTNEI